MNLFGLDIYARGQIVSAGRNDGTAGKNNGTDVFF